MSGNKVFTVYVPVIAYVPIRIEGKYPHPGETLEAAGAIARLNAQENPNAIAVVSSDKQPWVVANEDGSSPNRFEKIHVVGKGYQWAPVGKNKRGYGY